MEKMTIPMANPQANVRQAPASPAGVGNEKTADMSVVGKTGLGHAVEHLRSNLDSGVPHIPLHGLRAGKKG